MTSNIEFGQFQRIELMIGREGLNRLQNSFVAVAGLGAVGSFAAETIARAGVGRFLLIDCDSIHPSNINRQLFATWETVGQKKTDAAERRLLSIAPNCRIEKRDVLLNSASIPEIVQEWNEPSRRPDFLIDAIDSLGPKVDLIDATLKAGIPFMSSMGAALKTDPTRIQTGRLTDVSYCPLAAMLRKRLRRRGVSTDNVFAVFSTEEVRETQRTKMLPADDSEDEKPLNGRRRNTLGSFPTITGIFGLLIAHQTLTFLLERRKSKPTS